MEHDRSNGGSVRGGDGMTWRRFGLAIRATAGLTFMVGAMMHDYPRPMYVGQHMIIHEHPGTYPLWFLAGWLAGSTVWHFIKNR